MSFSSCFRKASSSKLGGATPVESVADVGAGAGAVAGSAALGLEKSSRTSAIVSMDGEGRE